MKYNLGHVGLVVFVRELQDRACTRGWSICAQNITHYLNAGGGEVHIITAYGLIDDQTLKTATNPLVLLVGAEYEMRKSNNNARIKCCLMVTLTDDAEAKVIAFRNEFEHVENNQTFTSSPLVLKTMMRLATLDIKVTSETLRKKHKSFQLMKYRLKTSMKLTLL